MSLVPRLGRWLRALAQPETSPELEAALAAHRERVPVLWLLGKTGAGKTSIVQRLTGDSRAEIGNGFEPCTSAASLYDHPREGPVMRFLDTRGLGEPRYDPREDLAACRSASHALVLVTRVDDTAQGALVAALERLGAAAERLAVLHVHSALHAVSDVSTRRRAIAHNARAVAEALGREAPSVEIDFTEPEDGFEDPDVGLESLRGAIVDLVPALEEALAVHDAGDREERAFAAHRNEVLGYAGAAAAVDLVPGLGLVAVPSVQGKLLHALAGRYGVAWNRRTARRFLAVLGTSFLYRYALSLTGRQLAKLVPVYGQTAGAAAAASISFASTYALGRAGCLYLFRQASGEPVETEDLREAFRRAFDETRRGGARQVPELAETDSARGGAVAAAGDARDRDASDTTNGRRAPDDAGVGTGNDERRGGKGSIDGDPPDGPPVPRADGDGR